MKSKRKVLLALTINKHYFIRGVVRYAREHDWYLVTDMMYTGRVPLGWRGDGILTILGYRKELADFIKSAGVPTVAITLVNDKIPLPRVEGDNVKIGQLAAEHFLERGYRHFAWAPFLNDVMDSERHEGFARRLEKRGFACHTLPQAHSLTGSVWQENWAERRGRLIRELKELPRPAAIFAYNDCVAADIMDACRDAGLLVPEQIAVLGVDNDPDICDCAPVPLSSVVHDLEGMAYQGAAMLDRLMKGGRAPKRVLRIPPKGVVTRVSTDIRQWFGYERHDNPEVVEPMNELAKGAYGQLLNFFHASLKLESKEREEGRVRRIYGVARTPLARVLASPEVSPQTKRRLEQEKARLNPFALKEVIARSLKTIASLRQARP
jgi:LacI family transcriptional regulator